MYSRISMPWDHQKVHEGVWCTTSRIFIDVPADGFARLRLQTSTKACHLIIAVDATAKCYWFTYDGGTEYSNNGIPADIFNRLYGGKPADASVHYGVVPSTYGQKRVQRVLPGGRGGTASGGSGQAGVESIVTPGNQILIELQNKDGQVRDIGIVLEWYEVDV